MRNVNKLNLVSGTVCLVILIRFFFEMYTGKEHTIFIYLSAVAAIIGLIAYIIGILKHKK